MDKISAWGNYPVINANVFDFERESDLRNILSSQNDYIPQGYRRSYGDSALNKNIITSLRFNKIIEFDSVFGTLICESGILLSELLDFLIPNKHFLPVTPGTKYITIGGAIASDVHGKNHHKDGCFSNFVEWLDLMLPDGDIVRCSPYNNTELFKATCGGMGLTGFILRSKIRLKKIKNAFIKELLIPCKNLEEIFANFLRYEDKTYSVAWIDCLAKKKNIGRSILMVGEHSQNNDDLHFKNNNLFNVPFFFPNYTLNRFSVSAFNNFYYSIKNIGKKDNIKSINSFFYPLDSIGNWNKIYGKSGFTQYQFVLPKNNSFKGLGIILQKIQKSGLGSFLAVLKLFGKENPNYLSFPIEGYTLALDFKIEKKLFTLLNELDETVKSLGGRIYLAKDVRMQADFFKSSYPNINQFQKLRQSINALKINSIQSKRLEL